MGTSSFEVLLKCVRSGSWLFSEPPHTEITRQLDTLTLLPISKFILCPGIRDYEKEFGESVHFQSNNLRVWTIPHHLHDSNQCLLWDKPSNVQLSVLTPHCMIAAPTARHSTTAYKPSRSVPFPAHHYTSGQNCFPTAPWNTNLQLVKWRSWPGRERR